MADLSAKKSNFISRSVAAAQSLKSARETLLAIRSEYDGLALGSSLVDADFTGANAHITATQLTALMTSQANLETFWNAGNGTNIDRITP